MYPSYWDSPYLEHLNAGIIKLHDKGVIDSIREKWVKYSERNCEQVKSIHFFLKLITVSLKMPTTVLTFDNIGGTFVFLGCGLSLGLLCSFVLFLARKVIKCVK